MSSDTRLRPSTMLLTFGLLALPLAAHAGDGFVADISLGAGDGNFDIDVEDGSDVGAIFEIRLGHAFENGLGLGGGLGADVAFTPSYCIELSEDRGLALRGGIFHRIYGVALQYGDGEEVSMSGLLLGVRWR